MPGVIHDPSFPLVRLASRGVTDTISIIRNEAARLAAVARIEPGAPVPQYAGWAMTDLIAHTGSVHQRTIDIVRNLPDENPGRSPAPTLEPDDLIDWFEAGAAEMANLLESSDPATPVWGFGPSPDIEFWKTRMALETSVHRMDAEEAIGEAADMIPELATLGIDEFGIMWLGGLPVPEGATGRYVALEATDVGVRWVIIANDRFAIERSEEPARVSLSDTASDLYLFLIGRIPHHRLTASGDPAALEGWVAALATQKDATL